MNKKIRQNICVGDNIRALHQNAHLTQEEMVAKLNKYGITSSYMGCRNWQKNILR